MSKRDDFSQLTKEKLAKTVGFMCSKPECMEITVGPNGDFSKAINLGIAAHICAASENGPRYDPLMTSEERKSFENGIWLCLKHGRQVDVDKDSYSKELLKDWKNKAMTKARDRLQQNDDYQIKTYSKIDKKILSKISSTMKDSNSKEMIKNFDYGNDYNRRDLNLLYELSDYLSEKHHKIKDEELKKEITAFKNALEIFKNHLVIKGGKSHRIPNAYEIELKEEQSLANEYATNVWNIYGDVIEDYIDEILN